MCHCAFVAPVLKAGFNFGSWNFLCSQNGLIAVSPFALQVDDFLQALITYDKEHIPENCLKVVNEQYLKDPEFNPNLIRTKSFAAAGLCAWVINIIKFYEVTVFLKLISLSWHLYYMYKVLWPYSTPITPSSSPLLLISFRSQLVPYSMSSEKNFYSLSLIGVPCVSTSLGGLFTKAWATQPAAALPQKVIIPTWQPRGLSSWGASWPAPPSLRILHSQACACLVQSPQLLLSSWGKGQHSIAFRPTSSFCLRSAVFLRPRGRK